MKHTNNTKNSIILLWVLLPILAILIVALLILEKKNKKKKVTFSDIVDCRTITDSNECSSHPTCRYGALSNQCVNAVDCSKIKSSDCYKHFSCDVRSTPDGDLKCVNAYNRSCDNLGAPICNDIESCRWSHGKCTGTDVPCEYMDAMDPCMHTDQRCYWWNNKCNTTPTNCSDIKTDENLCNYTKGCRWWRGKCWKIPDS